MLAELTQIESGWVLACAFGIAFMVRAGLAGRRRIALNEALHELRRPLQALVLSAPGGAAAQSLGSDLLSQTTVALERLDREINRGPQTPNHAPVAAAGLLEAAHRRWRRHAILAGASLDLRLGVGEAIVVGDRDEFVRALDNLIINAIEHGGPHVVIDAELKPDLDLLRVKVTDSGRAGAPRSRRPLLGSALAALSGRRRHGHGLRVVRRVAAAHGGGFQLRRDGSGAEAILELPLSEAVGGV